MAVADFSAASDWLRRAVLLTFPQRQDITTIAPQPVAYAQAWSALAQRLTLDDDALAAAIAPTVGIGHEHPLSKPDTNAMNVLPFSFCKAHGVLPLRLMDERIVVACANPADAGLNERIRFLSGRSVEYRLAAPSTLERAILDAYGQRDLHDSHPAPAPAASADAPDTPDLDHAIVKLGRGLMAEAVKQRASDLHVQPHLGSALVRIRVDGVLRRLTMLPEAVAAAWIRHVMARSGMDPTNALVPQDGRMSAHIEGRDLDLRISVLPAQNGERLVIRFLDQSRVHALKGAGFSLAALQTLRRLAASPSGLVIVTGPTGSGKTSTLYGLLAELNRTSVNIITVEDPVEYRLLGVSQVEVNDKADRGFAAALRSILRQDPDVILIGEIRDRETAEIAVQAALTGHLVLTTLHTNSALMSVPRLLNLGVQPTVLADSLTGLISQRLCRTLCPHCRAPVTEPLRPEEALFLQATRSLPASRAAGCGQCNHTGYLGRFPLVEMVEVQDRLRAAIASGESRLAELETLREGGLTSLAVSGALRIISGETTVGEVLMAVGHPFWAELGRHYGTAVDPGGVWAQLRPGDTAGVVLITTDPALARRLEPEMSAAGYRLMVCATPEEAAQVLRRDEDIVFVILDLPEGTGFDNACHAFAGARQALAWSRLPALVLVSQDLVLMEARLRENGLGSPCLAKPAEPAAVVLHVLRSQVR